MFGVILLTDLDLDSWIPIMLSDGLDAVAAADTLVRDGDLVNDTLIPELLELARNAAAEPAN